MALRALVEKAINLKNKELIGKSDPYAQIELNGKKAKTKSIDDNLNPEWNESITIDLEGKALTGSDELLVKVFDYDKAGIDKFMGQVKIPLGTMITGEKEKKHTLTLTDKNDKATDATIVLTITYEPPAENSGEGAAGAAGSGEGGKPSSNSGQKATGLPVTANKSYSTKIQDFQIRVRIHEARQLPGSNISPLCKMTCWNQNQITNVKPSTNSPFWGQTFFFNFHESPAKLFEQTICFAVFNSRKMRSDAHIGSFDLDLAAVYESPDHSIMHKWLLLGEPEDPQAGSKGYLKVAIVILGPGDEAPSLKLKESDEEEDIEANILRPAGVQLRPAFFKLTLYNGEDFPRMDSNAFSGVKKFFGSKEEKEFVDPYAIVRFAGKEIKTSIKEGTDHPEWNEQLNVAVQFPSMCDKVALTIYDWDRLSKNDPIATAFIALTDISALRDGEDGYLPTFGPTFINLYGSPREFCDLDDKLEKLNLGKGEGAAYRGRVLCELSTELLEEPQDCKVVPVDEDQKQLIQKYMRRRKYVLHTAFYQANMVDCSDGAVEFEISIGNYGNNLDETIPPCCSTTPPTNAVSDGCYYKFLPWGENKPCALVESHWEDISYRLYAVNFIHRIFDTLEYGIEGIEMSMKVDMDEADLANTVIMCLDQLILDCATPLPEWQEGCSPLNDLDRKILKLRKDDIADVVKKATKIREEATSVEDVLLELKQYLGILKNLITEPQNSMPDVIIWMLVADKRVAYFRIPAYDVLYAENEQYRGRYCGSTRTIQLKVPKLDSAKNDELCKIPAQLRIGLWLGLERDQHAWINRDDEGLLAIVAETYENQASIAGKWSSHKPPLTRSPWTDSTGKIELEKDWFKLPDGWKWDSEWYLSPEMSILFKTDAGSKVFVEEIYCNETRTPATSWALSTVPYTDSQNEPRPSPTDFKLPDGWTWQEEAWCVDLSRPCDEEGYEYSAEAKLGNYVAVEKVYHMCRRKRLTRKRILSDSIKNVKEGLQSKLLAKKQDERLGLLDSLKPAAGEGWEYALNFISKFHSKEKSTDAARRRRWHRKVAPLKPEISTTCVFHVNKGKMDEEKKKKKKQVEDVATPRIFVKYETGRAWQLRAYIFQARSLLAGDQTGLSDPYIRVCFNCFSQKSERLEKTLCPQWDQTLIFDDVILYGSPESIMNSPPPINVEIFDWDQIGTDSHLGSCKAIPVVTTDPDQFHNVFLQWFPIKFNDKDGGELLAQFELLLMDGNPVPKPPPRRGDLYIVPEGIRPEMQNTGIEVLCWGVRNMRKYQLANVNSPSVEIDIGGNILQSDTIGNLKRRPNFAKPLLFLKALLPKEALYMPPINIMVRDNRPFGRKPLVGTHVLSDISLFRVEPLLEPYDPLAQIPELARAGSPPLIHQPSSPKKKDAKNEKPVKAVDLVELDANIDWYSKFYASQGLWHKCLDYKERNYDTLLYLEHPLESLKEFNNFADFCTNFPLHRGKSADNDDDDNYCGDFKGTFRVYSLPEDPTAKQPLRYLDSEVPPSDPVECIVRVYIVRAIDLQPSDPSGLADPYIEIRLGSQKISNKDHYIPNNLNPEFGRMFQLKCLIPVEKDLIIRVIDYDLMTRDDEIGETVIDLENRLLTRFRAICGLPQTYTVSGPNQWRDAQKPTEILKEFCLKHRLPEPVFSDPDTDGTTTCSISQHFFNLDNFEKNLIPNPHFGVPRERLALHILNALPLVKEHVETRPLFSPVQPNIEQGKLQLWVDIFPTFLGNPGPEFVIMPRRATEYILRVIVWNTVDVILDETSITGERMSDIYVKGWMMGVENREKTDVHYRSLNGEGNFNYRLLFPFDYITAENELVVTKKEHFWSLDKTEKRMPAVLCLQVWDNDLFSADDFIGTLELPLIKMPSPTKLAKECTIDMVKPDHPKTKITNLFDCKRTSGFWPFVDQPGPDMKLTGKLEAEIELVTKEDSILRPAAFGQEEPNSNPHLDKPKRPETSFFWFTSPFKTCKFIICKRFKCIMLTVLGVFLAVLIVALFIYAVPGLLAQKMIGV